MVNLCLERNLHHGLISTSMRLPQGFNDSPSGAGKGNYLEILWKIWMCRLCTVYSTTIPVVINLMRIRSEQAQNSLPLLLSPPNASDRHPSALLSRPNRSSEFARVIGSSFTLHQVVRLAKTSIPISVHRQIHSLQQQHPMQPSGFACSRTLIDIR